MDDNGRRTIGTAADDLPVIEVVDAPLVRVPVGQLVEVGLTAFQPTLVRPRPDVHVHLVTLELGLVRETFATNRANIGFLMVLQMLVDLMDSQFLLPLELFATQVAVQQSVVSLKNKKKRYYVNVDQN